MDVMKNRKMHSMKNGNLNYEYTILQNTNRRLHQYYCGHCLLSELYLEASVEWMSFSLLPEQLRRWLRSKLELLS